ncbi:MAG: DinB family protein [Trueperaceae bacterium]
MTSDLRIARDEHAKATEGWRELACGLSPAQGSWRPAPDRWSLAQGLDHVGIVNGAVAAKLAKAVDDARSRGLVAPGPFRYGPIGRWYLAAVGPQGGWSVRAPGPFRPADAELGLAEAMDRFEAAQEGFDRVLDGAEGIHLSRVRVSLPALPWLRLQLGIWLLALPQHTLRHLEQARRVRDDPGFPAA